MGTLTEYFKYLSASPKKLTETVQTFSHFTPTEETKKERNRLKLYENKESVQCSLNFE